MNIKKKYFPYIISFCICLFFFFIYSYQSFKLYDAHRYHGDLTSFAQAMWNTTQGRIMQNTFNFSVHNFWSKNPQSNIPDNSNILGIHFNPILFIFIPIYYVFPTPKTLLLIQSLLITMSGLIIFLIALKKINNKIISLLIQLSFLIYFALVSAVLDEFHAYTLAIFFGILLIYFSGRKGWIYYLTLFLLFLVQENTSIITIFFGLYLLFLEKSVKKGLITFLLSIAYFFLATKVIISMISIYHSYMFEGIYGNPLGGSIVQIITNSITKPYLLYSTLINEPNIKYLLMVAAPTLPFVIFSPVMLLIAFSGLITNLLSSSASLKSTLLHYEALSIPFLYYSLILGIENIFKYYKNYRKFLSLLCISILVLSILISYKIFTSKKINKTVFTQNIYSKVDKELDELIKKIPNNASVSTQDYISAQLSQRKKLYLFPVYYNKVDYLLLATCQPTWPLDNKTQIKIIDQLKNDKSYLVKSESKNFILLKKQQ